MPRHRPPGAGSSVRILLFLIMIVFVIMVKMSANKASREQNAAKKAANPTESVTPAPASPSNP